MESPKKMKTGLMVFMTVLLLIMSNTSYSQYNIRELKLKSSNSGFSSMSYSNSNGEKGISVFEYGDDGRLIRSLWRLLDNSRSSVNYYKFDQRGNITEKYKEFSGSYSQTFTYDY